MKYQRLTREERYQIEALLRNGFSQRKIALTLGRSPATISREIRRNKSQGYRPNPAHELALQRRENVHPPVKVHGELAKIVRKLLGQQWSPEQIAGRFRLQGIRVSHEAIYQFIYRDFYNGGRLYQNLRRRRKYRRSRKTARNFKNVGIRINRDWIEERPKIVEKRCRLGDFERDTLLGKSKYPLLLTLVDRLSRLTRIAKMEKFNAELTHKQTLKLLKNLTVCTITNDNGPEFAEHKATAKVLRANIYFNHPYSSWQRGTNENTNGLIRQYYPKGIDFTRISETQIKKVERLLNNRPRKCLGFKTPLEIHSELSRGVALRI